MCHGVEQFWLRLTYVAWQMRIDHDVFACGCHEAFLGAMSALSIVFAWRLAHQHIGLAAIIGAAVGGAVCGKFFGHWRARRRLSRTLRALLPLLR